jgi:uncharacterized membrane protein YqaE (UPF0057 family)
MKKVLFYSLFSLLQYAFVQSYAAKLTATTPDTAAQSNLSNATIQEGLKGFKSLSHKEQRLKMREMKRIVKEFKEDKKAGKDVDTDLILQVILGLFIPPLGVYLHEGETNNKFWISILLTVLGLLIFGFAGVLFLGTLPSIIYALIVILGK